MAAEDTALLIIKQKGFATFHPEDSTVSKQTVDSLRAFGLIEPHGQNRFTWRLTDKGYKAIEIGVDNWRVENEKPKQTATFHIGENKGVIANQSNFENSPLTNLSVNTPTQTEKKTIQKILWDIASKSALYIFNNMVQLLVALLAGYLIHLFQWTN